MTKTVPTIQKVFEKYPKFAAVERLRAGKPGVKTVRNLLVSIRRLCQMAGIPLESPVSVFTRKRLTKVLDSAARENLKPIWSRLCAYRDEGEHHYKRRGWGKLEERNAPLVVPCAKDVFIRLNADLCSRKIFTGSKGCYELRKVCIDHVYQKFGAEMAASISGDGIRTMMRYYADPSQPNIGDIRIIDLI